MNDIFVRKYAVSTHAHRLVLGALGPTRSPFAPLQHAPCDRQHPVCGCVWCAQHRGTTFCMDVSLHGIFASAREWRSSPPPSCPCGFEHDGECVDLVEHVQEWHVDAVAFDHMDQLIRYRIRCNATQHVGTPPSKLQPSTLQASTLQASTLQRSTASLDTAQSRSASHHTASNTTVPSEPATSRRCARCARVFVRACMPTVCVRA